MTRETFNTLTVRLAVELLVAGIFAVILWRQDAPAWTFTLLILIGTRASKLELHNGLGYLQQTLKRRDIAAQSSVLSPESERELAEALDAAERARIAGQQSAKRHDGGRWGRG